MKNRIKAQFTYDVTFFGRRGSLQEYDGVDFLYVDLAFLAIFAGRGRAMGVKTPENYCDVICEHPLTLSFI